MIVSILSCKKSRSSFFKTLGHKRYFFKIFGNPLLVLHFIGCLKTVDVMCGAELLEWRPRHGRALTAHTHSHKGDVQIRKKKKSSNIIFHRQRLQPFANKVWTGQNEDFGSYKSELEDAKTGRYYPASFSTFHQIFEVRTCFYDTELKGGKSGLISNVI